MLLSTVQGSGELPEGPLSTTPPSLDQSSPPLVQGMSRLLSPRANLQDPESPKKDKDKNLDRVKFLGVPFLSRGSQTSPISPCPFPSPVFMPIFIPK